MTTKRGTFFSWLASASALALAASLSACVGSAPRAGEAGSTLGVETARLAPATRFAALGPTVRVAALSDVGGCESATLDGALRARPVDGVLDLYLLEVDGRGQCVDSGAGFASRGIGFRRLDTARSDPMPGDPASSDPMPGDDGDPTKVTTSSDPMPGQTR